MSETPQECGDRTQDGAENSFASTKPENIEQTSVKSPEIAEESEVNSDNKQLSAQPEVDLVEVSKVENIDPREEVKMLRSQLSAHVQEIDLLKTKISTLESELQAALSKPAGKQHEIIENIKQQHEELLAKARGMIFDKTKMVKNQELQIQALTAQVQSLKDINVITKDLLEIRNGENQAMEERFKALEARLKAEKEKHSLVMQRTQRSTSLTGDLKKEYETQLAIFKELRQKYEQRVQALIKENDKLKDLIEAKNEASKNVA